MLCFFFSSRRRHTRLTCDWSSDVCSSDLGGPVRAGARGRVDVGVDDRAEDRVRVRQGRGGGEDARAGERPGQLGRVLQIGRASWRGRGESSGGGGALKKKTDGGGGS